jgi:serine/threonine protein phosphatase PrpC
MISENPNNQEDVAMNGSAKPKRKGRNSKAKTNGAKTVGAKKEKKSGIVAPLPASVMAVAEPLPETPVEADEEVKPGLFSHLGVRRNGTMTDLPPPPPPPVNGDSETTSVDHDFYSKIVENKGLSGKMQAIELAPLPPLPDELHQNVSGRGNYAEPYTVTAQNITAAFVTDVGQVRSNNQDNAAIFAGTVHASKNAPEILFGFFAVADGMGGHDKGELASRIALQVTTRGVLRDYYNTIINGEQPGGGELSPVDLLTKIIEEANVAIIEEANRLGLNMGTTISCFLVMGGVAFVGHLGDSRIYGIERENGTLVQLSEDHSVVARLVALGHLTPDEAQESPQRSMLYRSMGQRPGNYADTDLIYLSDYSHFLICSDGLWDMVTDSAIEYFLKQEREPAQICRNLVDAANSAGGDDNVTVLVVKLN